MGIAMYELRADIRRVCLVSSLHTLHDPPFSHISTHPTTNQPTTTQVSYIVHFTRVLAGSEAEADRVAKLVQVTQQPEKTQHLAGRTNCHTRHTNPTDRPLTNHSTAVGREGRLRRGLHGAPPRRRAGPGPQRRAAPSVPAPRAGARASPSRIRPAPPAPQTPRGLPLRRRRGGGRGRGGGAWLVAVW